MAPSPWSTRTHTVCAETTSANSPRQRPSSARFHGPKLDLRAWSVSVIQQHPPSSPSPQQKQPVQAEDVQSHRKDPGAWSSKPWLCAPNTHLPPRGRKQGQSLLRPSLHSSPPMPGEQRRRDWLTTKCQNFSRTPLLEYPPLDLDPSMAQKMASGYQRLRSGQWIKVTSAVPCVRKSGIPPLRESQSGAHPRAKMESTA